MYKLMGVWWHCWVSYASRITYEDCGTYRVETWIEIVSLSFLPAQEIRNATN